MQLSKTHARIASVRRDFVHRESTRLAKTHGHLVIEKLCISGLIRSRLSRAIADSAWSLFATLLSYKASWYGAVLTVADRFYPSTRRCSACGRDGSRAPAQSSELFAAAVAGTRPTATRTLQRAWRSTPRYWRPATGLTSPRSTRRRKTSVERKR